MQFQKMVLLIMLLLTVLEILAFEVEKFYKIFAESACF